MLFGIPTSDKLYEKDFTPIGKRNSKYYLHKSRDSRYYGAVAKCSRTHRTQITTGKWSFRAPEDWDPLHFNMEEPAFILKTLSGASPPPEWAYRIRLCSKCFPRVMVEHICSCGHIHKTDKREIPVDTPV